jgi:hypothetical protein
MLVKLILVMLTIQKDKRRKVEIEQKTLKKKPKVETKPNVERKKKKLKQMTYQKYLNLFKKELINLTRRYREAERREQAALDFAKGLQKKYSDSEKKFDTADRKLLERI